MKERVIFTPRSVPASAKVPCDAPSPLGKGTIGDLRLALARDGQALNACEARRKAAVEGAP
ncbi:MAG: hypothetical protein ACRDBL_09125 [Rhabdaerophilum sp.]